MSFLATLVLYDQAVKNFLLFMEVSKLSQGCFSTVPRLSGSLLQDQGPPILYLSVFHTGCLQKSSISVHFDWEITVFSCKLSRCLDCWSKHITTHSQKAKHLNHPHLLWFSLYLTHLSYHSFRCFEGQGRCPQFGFAIVQV